MAEHIKQIIKLILDRGYLIEPSFLDNNKLNFEILDKYLKKNESGEMLMFDENLLNNLIFKHKKNIEVRPLIKLGKDSLNINSNVEIVKSFDKKSQKLEVNDFTLHYTRRYEQLRNLLQSRTELLAPLSINRILSKKDKENLSTIGIVFEKRYSKNNHLILTIEDHTGSIPILINNSKKELFEKVKDIVLDEVIGIKGVNGDKIIFVEDIFFPDIPKNTNIKKSSEEEYIAILSDFHVGSELFLESEFLKFIEWLNLKSGTKEQKEVAKKIKHIFIVGDLVDGVGIYPNQDDEQNIPDIKLQYQKVIDLVKIIRKDINIIICPGNHDAVRLAEPQPVLGRDLINELYEMDNVTLVSNPSYVNISKTENFEGFNVLLYHGYSYDTYSENVESIRFSGETISDRINLVMRFLLQKRHLAPTHGSTLFVPNKEEDNLVIDIVPDFFISGHIHKSNITQYGKVTKVAGSCWQSITPFQLKVGHRPEPGRVPIINLKTRESKILKFYEEDGK
jgi:DNA polymerase II small subunit